MADSLTLPAEAAATLEKLYWLFPFSRTAYAKGSTRKIVAVPVPPRPVPRRQFASASERLGQPIPDWVAGLWACRVHIGLLSNMEAAALGEYICGVDAAAHAGGAPADVIFFAGASTLFPGSNVYTDRGEEYRRGDMSSFVYGFDPKSEGADLITYLQTAKDPARRVVRADVSEFLQTQIHTMLEGDRPDEVELLGPADRPPFTLCWEDETPAMTAPLEGRLDPDAPLRVRHAKFGVGVVVAREGSGDTAKLTVEFEDGKRTILARFLAPAGD